MTIGPKHFMRLVCEGGTRAGTVERPNEDCIRIVHAGAPASEEQGSLLIVADGLGGHGNGDVASRMVCEELPPLYFGSSDGNRRPDLRAAVMKTNQVLHAASSAAGQRHGMCSTLVAAAVVGDTLTMVHVGDSKGFLFRGGKVAYASPEHCIRVARFESEDTRYLTQSVGSRAGVLPSDKQIQLEHDDVIVLCTDGLWDSVSPMDILAECTANEPEVAVSHLISAAKEKGSTDDVSIVIARVIAY